MRNSDNRIFRGSRCTSSVFRPSTNTLGSHPSMYLPHSAAATGMRAGAAGCYGTWAAASPTRCHLIGRAPSCDKRDAGRRPTNSEPSGSGRSTSMSTARCTCRRSWAACSGIPRTATACRGAAARDCREERNTMNRAHETSVVATRLRDQSYHSDSTPFEGLRERDFIHKRKSNSRHTDPEPVRSRCSRTSCSEPGNQRPTDTPSRTRTREEETDCWGFDRGTASPPGIRRHPSCSSSERPAIHRCLTRRRYSMLHLRSSRPIHLRVLQNRWRRRS